MMQIKLNPSGVPSGAGALSKRGRVYWILYRDTEDKIIQENSHTADLS